jgi:hypothetical protein
MYCERILWIKVAHERLRLHMEQIEKEERRSKVDKVSTINYTHTYIAKKHFQVVEG